MKKKRANTPSNGRRLSALSPVGPLDHIESRIGDLPTALARAAVYIAENPEKVVRYSLKELSKFSRTGEASIVRLCHIAGFEGYSEFKLALAGQLAVRQTIATDADEESENHIVAMGQELAKSILRTIDLTELSDLARIAERLSGTTRIDLFGSGVSGIIAELFAYRLLRAGLNAHVIRDITLANEVANGLNSKAAALAISDSGVTANTVEFLKSARSAGAFTVAVTCHARSELAKSANEVLLMSQMNIPAYGGFVNTVPRAVYLAEALCAFVKAPK